MLQNLKSDQQSDYRTQNSDFATISTNVDIPLLTIQQHIHKPGNKKLFLKFTLPELLWGIKLAEINCL